MEKRTSLEFQRRREHTAQNEYTNLMRKLGLRSQMEDRWKAAFREAGSGELDALRAADPQLVERDSATLGSALRRVVDSVARD